MDDPDRPPTTAEIAERMTSRLANSLVIAAGIIALGLYAGGGDGAAPRYQAVATPDGRVVRVNTKNGSVVSCDAARCLIIHRHGRDDLDHISDQPALPKAVAPPAAPAAPQPVPAPPAQPAAPTGQR
jgi:hypothetical protein